MCFLAVKPIALLCPSESRFIGVTLQTVYCEGLGTGQDSELHENYDKKRRRIWHSTGHNAQPWRAFPAK